MSVHPLSLSPSLLSLSLYLTHLSPTSISLVLLLFLALSHARFSLSHSFALSCLIIYTLSVSSFLYLLKYIYIFYIYVFYIYIFYIYMYI
jgi:hypothetical protein